MPYSPYDFDNHVVTEIYDRKLKKWIMLDPTTDSYFVDENKTPLSLLEMREKFANDEFVTYVQSTDSLKDLKKWQAKYMVENAYICKNLFYFIVDRECRFGLPETHLVFCPENYSIKEQQMGTLRFRINHIPEGREEWVEILNKNLEELADSEEVDKTNLVMMQMPPVD